MRILSASERLTMRAAARAANVSVATTWRWALRGVRGRRLRTFLIGGRRYVALSDLEAFVGHDESRKDVESNNNPDFARSDIAAAKLAQRGV